MFNRLSLSWRFSIIDISLFTILFIATNTRPVNEALILFFGALALRIFFIMLLMELASVFVVSLKRWLPVFAAYCICFFLGYLVILFFARQMMVDFSWSSFLFLIHATWTYSCYLLPFFTASIVFLFGLKH